MKELGYNTISRVMETWETARRVAKNFEDELGTHMLTKYVDKRQPEAGAPELVMFACSSMTVAYPPFFFYLLVADYLN